MFRGNVYYAVDLLLSGYETIPLGDNTNINLILSNPYIKAHSMVPDKEDSPFYIMFYIYDPEGVQKDVYMEYSPVEEYESIPNSVSNILAVKEDKYKLDFTQDVSKVSILYQSCGNSLKKVNIYSYDDLLNSFEVKNKYNLGVFNNYLIPNQVGPIFEEGKENPYTGAVIGIGLNEISQNDIDNFNNIEHKVRQNGKTLKWEKIEGVKEYIVYVFNKKNEDIKYIQNPCYLDYIQKNDLLDKNESDITYVAHYSAGTNNYLDLKENGTYVTTVMANLEGKMPMKFIYNEYNYNSSAEPYDEDEDKDKESDYTPLIVLLVTIPIIIILIIFLIILKK